MNDIFNKISKDLITHDLSIIDRDIKKPWGGYFVIDEKDIQIFLKLYFDQIEINKLSSKGKLSPKILIIYPHKRLSWQYHNRRGEMWKVISGKIKVVTSHDDKERKEIFLKGGDEIKLYQGERHRIVATNNYAVVAEIWIHTDKDNPSNEDDIVRLQDDFDR